MGESPPSLPPKGASQSGQPGSRKEFQVETVFKRFPQTLSLFLLPPSPFPDLARPNLAPSSSSFAPPSPSLPFDGPRALTDGEAPVPNVPARSVSSAAAADAGFPSIDALDRDDDDRRPPAAPQVNITGVTAPDDDDDGELDKFQAEYPDVDELLPAELKVRRERFPLSPTYPHTHTHTHPLPSLPISLLSCSGWRSREGDRARGAGRRGRARLARQGKASCKLCSRPPARPPSSPPPPCSPPPHRARSLEKGGRAGRGQRGCGGGEKGRGREGKVGG